MALQWAMAGEPASTQQVASVVSAWYGAVPLRDGRILAVDLHLMSDLSATWIEHRYRNWADCEKKRHADDTVQRGNYDRITREPSGGTVGQGEPYMIVTPVGLRFGAWRVDYGERKGSSILVGGADYQGTLILKERTNVTTKAEQTGGGSGVPLPQR
jgi:hypothetical protein